MAPKTLLLSRYAEPLAVSSGLPRQQRISNRNRGRQPLASLLGLTTSSIITMTSLLLISICFSSLIGQSTAAQSHPAMTDLNCMFFGFPDLEYDGKDRTEPLTEKNFNRTINAPGAKSVVFFTDTEADDSELDQYECFMQLSAQIMEKRGYKFFTVNTTQQAKLRKQEDVEKGEDTIHVYKDRNQIEFFGVRDPAVFVGWLMDVPDEDVTIITDSEDRRDFEAMADTHVRLIGYFEPGSDELEEYEEAAEEFMGEVEFFAVVSTKWAKRFGLDEVGEVHMYRPHEKKPIELPKDIDTEEEFEDWVEEHKDPIMIKLSLENYFNVWKDPEEGEFLILAFADDEDPEGRALIDLLEDLTNEYTEHAGHLEIVVIDPTEFPLMVDTWEEMFGVDIEGNPVLGYVDISEREGIWFDMDQLNLEDPDEYDEENEEVLERWIDQILDGSISLDGFSCESNHQSPKSMMMLKQSAKWSSTKWDQNLTLYLQDGNSSLIHKEKIWGNETAQNSKGNHVEFLPYQKQEKKCFGKLPNKNQKGSDVSPIETEPVEIGEQIKQRRKSEREKRKEEEKETNGIVSNRRLKKLKKLKSKKSRNLNGDNRRRRNSDDNSDEFSSLFDHLNSGLNFWGIFNPLVSMEGGQIPSPSSSPTPGFGGWEEICDVVMVRKIEFLQKEIASLRLVIKDQNRNFLLGTLTLPNSQRRGDVLADPQQRNLTQEFEASINRNRNGGSRNNRNNGNNNNDLAEKDAIIKAKKFPQNRNFTGLMFEDFLKVDQAPTKMMKFEFNLISELSQAMASLEDYEMADSSRFRTNSTEETYFHPANSQVCSIKSLNPGYGQETPAKTKAVVINQSEQVLVSNASFSSLTELGNNLASSGMTFCDYSVQTRTAECNMPVISKTFGHRVSRGFIPLRLASLCPKLLNNECCNSVLNDNQHCSKATKKLTWLNNLLQSTKRVLNYLQRLAASHWRFAKSNFHFRSAKLNPIVAYLGFAIIITIIQLVGVRMSITVCPGLMSDLRDRSQVIRSRLNV